MTTGTAIVAQLLSAGLNQMFMFFNGFLVPYPEIPVYWRWMNRVSPTTWMIYGLATSQLGDSTAPLVVPGAVVQKEQTVGQFMTSTFGYDFDFIWWCVAIVAAYCVFFRVGAALALRFISFQRR
jgi:ABC-type multidrug transport system permease subunit